MESPKIGLICVSLDGERTDLAKLFLRQAKDALREKGMRVAEGAENYTTSRGEVAKQAGKYREENVDCILYLIGTWILADHVVDALQASAGVPAAVWGVPEAASFSSVGANVVHGAPTEMGIPHRLFYGMPADAAVMEDICAYARACRVSRVMRGARFGMIGGRTISAYPTTGDANQIKALFGIETEQIDQMVLLEKARSIRKSEAEEVCGYVRENFGMVTVPDKILLKSANVYLALRQIKEEHALDFCSVKCIGEFMDTYTSCCLAVALLNDAGFTTGCQCSVNAGISSFLFSTLSGAPAFFGDVNMIDIRNGTARLINCGVIPTKLARSYRDVSWVPQYEYMGAGRGACAMFCCREGEVTFGTLGRENGTYVMNLAQGEAFMKPKEELAEVRTWAQAFIKLRCDPESFYGNILSNHSVMAYGDWKKELVEFCKLKQIRYYDNIK